MSEIKIPSNQNLIDYGKSLYAQFIGALFERFTRYDDAADKVASAQNAEKSATDLALMRDVPNTDDFAKPDQLPKMIPLYVTKSMENAIGEVFYSLDEEVDYSAIHIGDCFRLIITGSMDTAILSVASITRINSRTTFIAHGIMSEGVQNFNVIGSLSSNSNQLVIVPTTSTNGSGSDDSKAETVWNFALSCGPDESSGEIVCGYNVPDGFMDEAVDGDMVLLGGCRGVVIDGLPTQYSTEAAGLIIGSKTKYVMILGNESWQYYKVTKDSVVQEVNIPYQQANTNAQRMWKFEKGESADTYIVPDGWADKAKTGDYVNLYDEYFGFVSELMSGNAGGRIVALGKDLALHQMSFKNGKLVFEYGYNISSFDSRLKTLEKASVTLTQDEYDALTTKDPNTTYYITDNGGLLQ